MSLLSGLTSRARLLQRSHAPAIDSHGFRLCHARAVRGRACHGDGRGHACSLRRRCDGARRLAAGDRRISPQAERIPGSARRVRRGGGGLLVFDLRETKGPQRQAPGTPGHRAGRLCADAAAALQRAEAAGESGAGGREAAARAQAAAGGRRFPESRRRAFPVHAAAAGRRSRLQARLCPLRAGRRPDARAGGAGLFVRDRRQRQLRHAVGPESLKAGLPRDLDRDRLQPVAHHQQRRTAGRTGPRNHQGIDGKGRGAVGRAAQGDGSQACGAEKDGGVHAHRAGHLVRA